MVRTGLSSRRLALLGYGCHEAATNRVGASAGGPLVYRGSAHSCTQYRILQTRLSSPRSCAFVAAAAIRVDARREGGPLTSRNGFGWDASSGRNDAVQMEGARQYVQAMQGASSWLSNRAMSRGGCRSGLGRRGAKTGRFRQSPEAQDTSSFHHHAAIVISRGPTNLFPVNQYTLLAAAGLRVAHTGPMALDTSWYFSS